MKQAELELRRHDLAGSWYKDDPWTMQVVSILEAHVKEIGRYAKEGGELNIGTCFQTQGVCGLAYHKLTLCAFNPQRCDYFIEENHV